MKATIEYTELECTVYSAMAELQAIADMVEDETIDDDRLHELLLNTKDILKQAMSKVELECRASLDGRLANE